MKKKNNLPKLAFGATLAPQLFDLAANTLINGTTYAVTDMIKAIREPEQEMRPTKRNTGFVMKNGGTVGGPKKKYMKKKGKRIATDSPEYKEAYDEIMKNRAEGIYYDDYVVEEPLVVEGKKPTKKQMEKARAKIKADEEAMYNLLQAGVQAGSAEGLDKQGNYIPYYNEDPYRKGREFVQGLVNPFVTDSFTENALEYVPLLGQALSIDDAGLAFDDLFYEGNQQGTFSNALDLLGVLPFGKAGNLLKIPKYIEKTMDALNIYGTGKDVYQDNISPMLYPKTNNNLVPQNNNNFATGEEEFAMGGMIKRADGSYSKRGLWDNIRANKGSGKKPTKKMLEQERKINSKMAFGGMIDPSMYMQQMMYGSYAQGGQVDGPCPKGFIRVGNDCVPDPNMYGKVDNTYSDQNRQTDMYMNEMKRRFSTQVPEEKYTNALTTQQGRSNTINPADTIPIKQNNYTYFPDQEAFGKVPYIMNFPPVKGVIPTNQYINDYSPYKTPYAMGGQVPQNIPVEVEGGEAYELPNGEMGEFEGPSHNNGGIPVALPEETKVYSKQLKVNGKTMADRKTKREANVAKLEKILSKNPSDKFIKEALKRQQETAALEEQSDMAMQEQANQKQQMQQQPQQGMMQEQAMAGMMQDPAMMQQMGMMMYGGKLDNGTPPGGLGKLYSGYGSYPSYFYKKQEKDVDGKYFDTPTWSYYDPAGKGTDWVNVDTKHPAYTQLENMAKSENANKYFVADSKRSAFNILDYPYENISKFTREPIAMVSETPNATNQNFLATGKPMYKFPKAELRNWYKEQNDAEAEAHLKKFEKENPQLINAAITTQPNPPFFTEEQLNQLTNPQVNPLDIREKKGGVNVTNTNPYDAMNSILGNTFQNIAQSKDPYINTKGGMIPNPLYNEVIGNKMLKEEDPKKPNKFMNFLNKAVDETGDFFTGLFDKNGKPKKEGAKKGRTKVDGDLPLTAGDRMGMAGTMFGGLAPMTTTMLNRMMTPKNQNFFREYGAEGLRAMQEAQALSAINRDKQLADIKLGEEASRQRGRNSARGVNTLRAMDISSDIAANQAENQAYNSYAQQMMQLLGQKGQMENQQDQMVMQGETQRDLADRQDVDQFYTNLAENFASQSELMQKQGRDMNQAQYNKMILQMSPMFSKYGIGMDVRNGQYVLTYNGEDIDQTKARLIVEKGIEAEKKAALEATKKEEKKAGTTTPTTTTNAPVNSNVLPANNPLGLGNTPYFNPIFTDINIPTVTDKSLTKAATKRRK